MSIDAGRSIFGLPHSIKVQKDSLDVLLVLEEERVLNRLSDLVHLLQTDLLLLLVQSIFVQILNEFAAQGDILGDFLIVFLSLICQANLVRDANSFKVFDELTKIDKPCNEIALHIQAPQLPCLGIEMDPYVRNWSPKGLENEPIGVVPYSDGMLREMDH